MTTLWCAASSKHWNSCRIFAFMASWIFDIWFWLIFRFLPLPPSTSRRLYASKFNFKFFSYNPNISVQDFRVWPETLCSWKFHRHFLFFLLNPTEIGCIDRIYRWALKHESLPSSIESRRERLFRFFNFPNEYFMPFRPPPNDEINSCVALQLYHHCGEQSTREGKKWSH